MPERAAANGEVIAPLDEATVRAAARQLVAAGVEAIAIGFLHSYRFADHERQARRWVEETAFDLFCAPLARIDPNAEQQAQATSTFTAEVLYYAAPEAIRNAARYGRGGNAARPLHLNIGITRSDPAIGSGHSGLEVVIEDDGVGSRTTGPSNGGSGQGLALHSTMMAVVGGTLAVESQPDTRARVTLALPY